MEGGAAGTVEEGHPDRVHYQAEVVEFRKKGNAPLLDGTMHPGISRGPSEEYHPVRQLGCDFQEPIVKRKPVDLGHQHITHDGIRRTAARDILERRRRGPGFLDAEAGALEEPAQGAAH